MSAGELTLAQKVHGARRTFRQRYPQNEYPAADFDGSSWNLKRDGSRSLSYKIIFLPAKHSTADPFPEPLELALKVYFMETEFGHTQRISTVDGARGLWDYLSDAGCAATEFSWDTLSQVHLDGIEPWLLKSGRLTGDSVAVRMNAFKNFIGHLTAEAIAPPHLTVTVLSKRVEPLALTPSDKKKREDRLAPLDVVEALGVLYRSIPADNTPDRLRICLVGLLLIAGFRSDELVALPRDGLRSEVDAHGRERWFIVYRNLKADPDSAEVFGRRWLSPLGATLAQELWHEVLAITKPWRWAAANLDKNTDRLCLPKQFAGREFISAFELGPLVGRHSRSAFIFPSHLPSLDLQRGRKQSPHPACGDARRAFA